MAMLHVGQKGQVVLAKELRDVLGFVQVIGWSLTFKGDGSS
ncbi:MAG: hypothetical protein OWU84_15090 [Firmicutes bacterium]|nr:hypothetical protein [Bacillota bacterium]